MKINHFFLAVLALGIVAIACQLSFPQLGSLLAAQPTPFPTSLPQRPVVPGEENPDEPVFVQGNIKYTSPFFVNSLTEPFVMLEDEAGFVRRDRDFTFPLQGQVIGPVQRSSEDELTYMLNLPAVPQGTLVDVDNDGEKDTGVQVFAIAYWSNTWGDPFLESRDGTGWSTAYCSTITDPNREDEIVGGTLLVWAPDDKQQFPTGFGKDGKLFTEDDPVAPIAAGYTYVNLDQQPFSFYKKAEARVDLNEGVGAVKDFSSLSYSEAFEQMFAKVSIEYPFTQEKGIDWDALREKYAPLVQKADNDEEFYEIIHDFLIEFPDGHVGGAFNAKAFYQVMGGGFGLAVATLNDGRVIVTRVFPDSAAEKAGIQRGAELISWDGKPIEEAISQAEPYFGPGSTPHTKRLAQEAFFMRVPPGTKVEVEFKNPDEAAQQVTMKAEAEYDSLTYVLYGEETNALSLPVEGKILEDSNLGYIRLDTFSDDEKLMARIWERFIKSLEENKVPGVIIDLRRNGGGNLGLAMNFAGFFFDKEIVLYQRLYYNRISKTFEVEGLPTKVKPAPDTIYKGKVALLISPDCVSACEGFAYAFSREKRGTIIGHYPTAGAFGEVGRGQYKLPGDIKLQFPTGRPVNLEGEMIIEGSGVKPDIVVPLTESEALGEEDALLEAAIQALTE